MARKSISEILGGETQFGRLTLVGEAPDRTFANGETVRQVYCRCKCGEVKAITLTKVRKTRNLMCARCNEIEPPADDWTGRRFGRLTVLGFDRRKPVKDGWREPIWRCRCDCGVEKTIGHVSLRNGHSTSCGCLMIERSISASTTHGEATGGEFKRYSKEYRCWLAMRGRCYTATSSSYPDYGGRGVSICDRWRFGEGGKHPFECFLEDMGPAPSPGHSIDRFPDNDGNYQPDNCRWATQSEQANNRRTSRL